MSSAPPWPLIRKLLTGPRIEVQRVSDIGPLAHGRLTISLSGMSIMGGVDLDPLEEARLVNLAADVALDDGTRWDFANGEWSVLLYLA